VRKLGADIEPHPALARQLEVAPEREAFNWLPLITVVAVIRRPRSARSRSRMRPGVRIEHEVFGRIEAMGVELLDEQRLGRHSIGETQCLAGWQIPQQQRLQIVLSVRSRYRQSAGIKSEGADRPISYCP